MESAGRLRSPRLSPAHDDGFPAAGTWDGAHAHAEDLIARPGGDIAPSRSSAVGAGTRDLRWRLRPPRVYGLSRSSRRPHSVVAPTSCLALGHFLPGRDVELVWLTDSVDLGAAANSSPRSAAHRANPIRCRGRHRRRARPRRQRQAAGALTGIGVRSPAAAGHGHRGAHSTSRPAARRCRVRLKDGRAARRSRRHVTSRSGTTLARSGEIAASARRRRSSSTALAAARSRGHRRRPPYRRSRCSPRPYYLTRALGRSPTFGSPSALAVAWRLSQFPSSNACPCLSSPTSAMSRGARISSRAGIDDGGVLVPSQSDASAADDDLVPAGKAHARGRILGGLAVLGAPQQLAGLHPRDDRSPAWPVPTHVTSVARVLPSPTPRLNERTWATLATASRWSPPGRFKAWWCFPCYRRYALVRPAAKIRAHSSICSANRRLGGSIATPDVMAATPARGARCCLPADAVLEGSAYSAAAPPASAVP